MKHLITLGCSWTWGAGAAYADGMSIEDYRRIAFDKTAADSLSFRTLLSNKFGYKNINMSIWRSSNRRQFRLARNFFSSPAFKEIDPSQTVVLWGITSTGRNELFSSNTNEYTNFLLSDSKRATEIEKEMSRFVLKNVYDHEHEIFELAQEMGHWNSFFAAIGVKNYWFDSFNHHDYSKNSPGFKPGLELDYGNSAKIDNFAIVHPTARDLMSQLAMSSQFNDTSKGYHTSEWVNDTNRIDHLVTAGLINPYSFHPTKRGHEEIAVMLGHVFHQ